MNCYSMQWVSTTKGSRQVPCSKCLACLTNKRNDWAFRLEHEYKRSKSAAFITLTYHPKFKPKDGVRKRHFQLFMKRLRKKSGQKLRYFAVGEYGTKTNRPHYHAIIFNYEGSIKFLEKIWSAPRTREVYGIVHIGKVNQATIMYCTKYVIQRGSHTSSHLNKPFMLCSRAYGLGINYLTDEMAKWHRSGDRNYTQVYGVKRRLPRYYKEKLWYPERKPIAGRNFWPEHDRRETVSQKSKNDALASEQKNRQIIIDAGYKNPDAIIAEMRQAVLNRIKEKVAYTQTF